MALLLGYVFAVAETMEDCPKIFNFLGNAFLRPERGKLLSNATQKIFDDATYAVSLVPQNERPKVYYAEGKDGLQWLANLLYPTYYPIDIQAETKKFYDLFMGMSLDEKTLHVILSPKSLAQKE